MQKYFPLVRQHIPTNQSAIVRPQPNNISRTVFHAIDIAYISKAELEAAFIIIRHTFLVCSRPYRTGRIGIERGHRIVRERAVIIRVVHQPEGLPILSHQLNAILIPPYPDIAIVILRNGTHDTAIISVSAGTGLPSFAGKMVNPHTFHAIHPYTFIVVYK